MFIVRDTRKAKFLVALIAMMLVVLLAGFFLAQVRTDGVIEWAILSFALLFLTPYFIIKTVLKESVKDYYLCFEINWKSIFWSLVGVGIFVVLIWALVVQLGWRGDMPVSRWILGSTGLLIFIDLVLVPVVLFAREFFFRGFLMKIFSETIGVVGAILLQGLLATVYVIHLEGYQNYHYTILLLIPNILLGYVAFVNKSVIVSAIVSWIYVLAVDFFVVYKLI